MDFLSLPASSKQKRQSLKIDMTPMVDLGFLLITFFIFTTSMAEPRATKLLMPADGKPTPVAESKTITAVLDADKIFWYAGKWEDAVANGFMEQTGYDTGHGIGQNIRKKQQELTGKGQKEQLLLIIKPLPSSTYQNLLAVLDEVLINNLTRYAVVDATIAEIQFAQQH